MTTATIRHLIIGTAGHVDHGKTQLIRALTGMETDRLKEEQQRGISIDLGFACFRLPGDIEAGVIDVPGHERFINNMLAGIGGIDLVMLVIDANEGVMPQTREHLNILELLQIQRGIIVLTKMDLVEPDWADIVEEEIRETLSGTFLAKAPLCRVSALTGEGLPQLRATLAACAAELRPRDADGPMRLPVDRHFSVAGFGTVVTGTLLSGRVATGDLVEVLPAGERVRVRDVQVHGQRQTVALCGQRVALNLAGLEREQLQRGAVIATPGVFEQTSRLDARLTLLAEAPRPVRFRDPVHFYLGTAHVVGLVALLDRDELKPGESALVQFHLDRPLVAHRQDRFIIRSYSPMTTIGGGLVIDPRPVKHKRFRPQVLQALKELESGEGTFVLQKLNDLQVARVKDLEQLSGLSRERIGLLLQQLQNNGAVVALADQWASQSTVQLWHQRLRQQVETFHRQQPLLPGMGHAPLKASLPAALNLKAFDQLLYQAGLQRCGEWVQLPDFVPQPSAAQQRQLDRLLQVYGQAGVQASGRRDMLAQAAISDDEADALLGYLFYRGELIRLNDDTYFHRDSYLQALTVLLDHFRQHDSLTLAQYRDLLGSARKPVQALLEHFDERKFCLRQGDSRRPWHLPASAAAALTPPASLAPTEENSP